MRFLFNYVMFTIWTTRCFQAKQMKTLDFWVVGCWFNRKKNVFFINLFLTLNFIETFNQKRIFQWNNMLKVKYAFVLHRSWSHLLDFFYRFQSFLLIRFSSFRCSLFWRDSGRDRPWKTSRRFDVNRVFEAQSATNMLYS